MEFNAAQTQLAVSGSVDTSFYTRLITLVLDPNDELDISTKGNWSYFDCLEVITTQKCSNHFENDAKKWHLHTVLAITFDPQRIF